MGRRLIIASVVVAFAVAAADGVVWALQDRAYTGAAAAAKWLLATLVLTGLGGLVDSVSGLILTLLWKGGVRELSLRMAEVRSATAAAGWAGLAAGSIPTAALSLAEMPVGVVAVATAVAVVSVAARIAAIGLEIQVQSLSARMAQEGLNLAEYRAAAWKVAALDFVDSLTGWSAAVYTVVSTLVTGVEGLPGNLAVGVAVKSAIAAAREIRVYLAARAAMR